MTYLLCLILFLAGCAAPEPQAPPKPKEVTPQVAELYYYVCTPDIDLWRIPTTIEPPIDTIQLNTCVKLIATTHEWGKIEFNGKKGWVRLKELHILPTPSRPAKRKVKHKGMEDDEDLYYPSAM